MLRRLISLLQFLDFQDARSYLRRLLLTQYHPLRLFIICTRVVNGHVLLIAALDVVKHPVHLFKLDKLARPLNRLLIVHKFLNIWPLPCCQLIFDQPFLILFR